MSSSDLARRASMMRLGARVYSSSAAGNLERSMTSLGVRTILPRWNAASTRSPSEMPARDRSLVGRVIWPLRWIFTRVVIRIECSMVKSPKVGLLRAAYRFWQMPSRGAPRMRPEAEAPLVKINCTAIPENLMESELFGFEKGAFTGAMNTKPGKFEQADTGTVFLDEIGDVPAAIQVKLLRVLQEREFERLGSNVTRHIDVRVIAATNQDLRAALEQGTFREDLYYRLNVVPLNIPPLRERKQDIPFLANHFVQKLAPDAGCQVESIADAAIEKLMGYHWPGNVRELENVIERSLVMCAGTRLEAADIKLESAPRKTPQGDSHFLPEGMSLDEYEKDIIREALRRADGNKSQAARLLGLTRNALRYRLTQMGMEA